MSVQRCEPKVNSNCTNFLLSNSHGKQVYRIQPDKFTFLKSNLLISNILNQNYSKQKKNVNKQTQEDSDAYVNCQVEMHRLEDQTDLKRAKNQRVRNLVKCRSQMTFDQLAFQQKLTNEKIQNVYLLRRQMVEKAAEIMGKKQDNSYQGRNLFRQKENILKELKQANPNQKITKTQTVRLLMKENAEKCHQKQFKQLLEDSGVNASFSKEKTNMSSLNSSQDVSFVDISNAKAMQQKIHNDCVLRKLMKNKSTVDFMQQQRRKAVWDGFSQHWRKGCEKQEERVKQLKKKKSKKAARPRFQTTDHQILNYHDQYTKLVAMKKYENAFAKTASSFQLNIGKKLSS